MNYTNFVIEKTVAHIPTGLVEWGDLPAGLFPFQVALTEWALRRGRCAIFADTGLGKTRMQLAWADAVHRTTGLDVLILAPLAVAAQTVHEGELIGVRVKLCRDGADVEPGITITNYDRLHRFTPSRFGAVVLDESSCIKHHDTRTLKTLLEAFKNTAFKLCATATPAPNDWTELGTHAEFLGICSRVEMLSEYFIHDAAKTQDWRLKGHARQLFWRWVSSWGAMVRKPSDLGFSDDGYALPPLTVQEHISATNHEEMATTGMLFALEANTLSERRLARKASIDTRIDSCVLLIKSEWAKLAALATEQPDGMETEICAGAAGEVECGPSLSVEAQRAGMQRPGSEEGVHARLLRSQPGEIQADAGDGCEAQRHSAGEICGVQSDAREDQGQVQTVARDKSSQTEGPTTQESVRDRLERLSGNACDTEGTLRDLRHGRYEQSTGLPCSGSLPQDGSDSGIALHELQSRIGQVQGQPGPDAMRGGVPHQAWIIWCELNTEQDLLERHFGKFAFSVRGSMTIEEKEASILGWLRRERPIMISKPSIMGWGINAQFCNRVAFVGVTDSWEAYYQAVRRCWRFGQRSKVDVHIFASELEGSVVANLKRKERDALAMSEALSVETHDAVIANVLGQLRTVNPYVPSVELVIPDWLVSEVA